MRELMKKYRDFPMALADAAPARVAEREKILRIFPLDRRDFSVYRPVGQATFLSSRSSLFPRSVTVRGHNLPIMATRPIFTKGHRLRGQTPLTVVAQLKRILPDFFGEAAALGAPRADQLFFRPDLLDCHREHLERTKTALSNGQDAIRKPEWITSLESTKA